MPLVFSSCLEDAVSSITVVIARLDRATQYSAAVVIEPGGHGVLDPHLRGDDELLCVVYS
jgi:hypothetical protein